MYVNDPIADMLTRIRNATMVKMDKVKMPYSKTKESIARVLKSENFINDFRIITLPDGKKMLSLHLKYFSKQRDNIIRGLKRISKPGRRVYSTVKELPRVLRGLGMALVSTPEGILTDKLCREKGVGGEVLCYVW